MTTNVALCYVSTVSHTTSKELLVGLHVRISKDLFDKLLARRDALRKTNPMTNLSDAVRIMLEDGVREKKR